MSDRVKYLNCPLCASQEFVKLKVGDCSKHPLYDSSLSQEIHWMECADCLHIFTDGYYTDMACEVIFGKTNHHQKVGAEIEANRYVSSRMVEKVLPYVSKGHWLDVGFGNGSLLFAAQEYGFNPIGTDLRVENVNVLKSIGIEAHCEDLTNLSLSAKCAVISMADVLEHVPYPKTALKAAYNLLENGGVLLISMPNAESVLWKILDAQNQNPYWGEMEHYHNFTRTRLYQLLEEYGFKPVRYGVSERYRACMEVVAVKKPRRKLFGLI